MAMAERRAFRCQSSPGIARPPARPSGEGDDPAPSEQPSADSAEDDGEPAAKRARTEATPSQEEGTCVELPAHGTVLGSASEYWKARLLRWRGDRSASEKGGCQVLEETFSSATEVEAAHSILQHAYTGKLPEAATVPLLMEMAILADKWQMSQVVTSCLTQAAAAQQLSLGDLKWMLEDGLSDSITSHAQFQTVMQTCRKELLKQFGRAQTIMAEPDQLQSFCSLSLRAVQLWAEQDLLTVDSENTVAVLFTHWWDKNSGSFCEQQKAAAATALTHLLRVGNLTNSFVYVAEQLPWFRPSKKELGMLRLLHGMEFHKLKATARGKLPTGWVKPPRAMDDQQESVLHGSFTRDDLEQLHKDAVASQGHAYAKQVINLYWQGYTWRLHLDLPSPQSALRCVLKNKLAVPSHLVGTLPPVTPVTFEFKVNARQQRKMYPLMAEGLALSSLLGVPECEVPRSNSFPPDNLWEDGKLHLQVVLKDVR